jgi:uncharacterized membrane protein (UPF0136 family)|tara:strand:+ start:365 stop:643 length:279 start_codon:yes stop_codon:yes gene_type:complete
MNKKYVHLIISTILLLPVSIMLENSDGLETVNDIMGYLIEWSAIIIISLIISGIFFGIKSALKKTSSFIRVLYTSSYILSIIVLLILSFKYL